MNLRILISIILVVVFLSCQQEKTTNNWSIGNNIAATIDGEPIWLSEIDQSAQQELYEQLYRIYIIRKIATKEKIKTILIDLEAQKSGMSKNEYIVEYYNQNLTDSILHISRLFKI